MIERNRRLVRQEFGPIAARRVASADHAERVSLHRLLALTAPHPGWSILDIATGGGHTALTFAPHSQKVIASDLTLRMLISAHRLAVEKDIRNIEFCLHDAERLPYPSNLFDLVTCRIAPHHFPDVPTFVGESARVLKSGGLLAVADNITCGEPKVARFINTIEMFRDPSHQWAYSEADWETFWASVGLILSHSETIKKRILFGPWAARMNVSASDRERLYALLSQAPAKPRAWLKVNNVDGQMAFWLREGIFIAQKP